MLHKGASLTIRSVERGRVVCPVRQRDVDVDRCLVCPFLQSSHLDQDDAIGEIACKPIYGAVSASGTGLVDCTGRTALM